jgi:DNA-binding XRE family transcriptional regulator
MNNRLMIRRAEVGHASGGRALSQQATATKAGISRDRYLRIENGYAEPTVEECMAIALALSTTAEAVFPEFAERFPDAAVGSVKAGQPCR